VTQTTFLQLVDVFELTSLQNGCRIPAGNSTADMPMRVAMTLAYLAQEGGFGATAALFGVAKATCITNVNQVRNVRLKMPCLLTCATCRF